MAATSPRRRRRLGNGLRNGSQPVRRAARRGGSGSNRLNQQSLERYEQVLNIHVKPALGKIALQKLTASMIDRLYADLAKSEIAPRTAHLIHVVFGACLATA